MYDTAPGGKFVRDVPLFFFRYFLCTFGKTDFSTSALGPGTPAKRSVSKNASQRYQGNVLNRIQSRDLKVFVFYRGERLFGILGFDARSPVPDDPITLYSLITR